MSTASDRVIAGYLNLTDNEKQLVVDGINRYNRGERKTKECMIQESKRVDLGSTGGGKCPCCGR